MSVHGYARIDPMPIIDVSLGRLAPAKTCCFCCKPENGIKYALIGFVVEAVWHILISLIRPLWEWTSTGLTIFAFILQDITRGLLIVLSVLAWRGLKTAGGAAQLRTFLRGLFFLIFLELMEMSLKFVEVNAVCSAPEVLAARIRRAKLRNATFDGNATLAAEEWCEVVSDLFDFVWGAVALLLLVYIMHIVHSYLRILEDTEQRARQQQQRAKELGGAPARPGEDPGEATPEAEGAQPGLEPGAQVPVAV